MNYGYLGASWANQAGQGQRNAQNQAQAWGQWAPQQANLQGQARQFEAQRAQNREGRRTKAFQFGINALTGLMR